MFRPQYGMALDENVEEGDQFFSDKDVKIVIDPMSLKYIAGSMVDYVETAMGGGFKVENPNATKSCGCGSSFTTEGRGGPDRLAAAAAPAAATRRIRPGLFRGRGHTASRPLSLYRAFPRPTQHHGNLRVALRQRALGLAASPV